MSAAKKQGTKAGHTPGPWAVDGGASSQLVWAGESRLIADLAASGAHAVPFDERKANARLIAAAPDLLESLEDFMLDHDNGLEPSVERLRAAIAKARGES